MARDTIGSKISALLEEKQYRTVRDIISEMQPYDIAALFEDIPEKQAIILFRIIPKNYAAETFVEMDPDQQEMLIRSFTDTELREVANELFIDDIVGILEEMPANVVKRILDNSTAEDRMMINEILRYPEDSAGSIMTTEFISLRSDMTIADTINKIRRVGLDSETIDTCYVTDNVRHLIGTVSIRTIILSDDSKKSKR